MKKTMIIELATFVLGTAFWAGLSFGAEQKQELRLSNTAVEVTDVHDWEFELGAGWFSKYVTEGIDCLPKSGIRELAPMIKYKDVSLSAWYANGIARSYEELDLVLSYSMKLGDFTLTPWYEHQMYFTQDYNVANPAVTISYELRDWLALGMDTQWKVEHQMLEGYYDVFIQATWEPVESVTIGSLIRFGYNSGYNTGARDGSNCIDYSVNVSWVFSPDVTLSCSANYSQATTVLRKIQEGNEFWLSLRMTHQF